MGYSFVPDIKDEAVVCQKQPCGHRDCKANIEQWKDAKCSICGEPLLAGQPFYYTSHEEETQCASRPTEPAHAHCVIEREAGIGA
jgi:hypothetical protein